MAGPRSYHEVLRDAEEQRAYLVKKILSQRQTPLRLGGPYDAPANLYDAGNAAVEADAGEVQALDLEATQTPGQLAQLAARAKTNEVRELINGLRGSCGHLHLLKE